MKKMRKMSSENIYKMAIETSNYGAARSSKNNVNLTEHQCVNLINTSWAVRSFFIQKCYVQLFFANSLCLYFLSKRQLVKCWWRYLRVLHRCRQVYFSFGYMTDLAKDTKNVAYLKKGEKKSKWLSWHFYQGWVQIWNSLKRCPLCEGWD